MPTRRFMAVVETDEIMPLVFYFSDKTTSKEAIMHAIAECLNKPSRPHLTAKDVFQRYEAQMRVEEKVGKTRDGRISTSSKKRSPTGGKNPESNRRLNKLRRDEVIKKLTKLHGFVVSPLNPPVRAVVNYAEYTEGEDDDAFASSPSKSTRGSQKGVVVKKGSKGSPTKDSPKKGAPVKVVKGKGKGKKGAATLKAAQIKFMANARKRIFDEAAMEQMHNQMESAAVKEGFKDLKDYSQKLIQKEVAALKNVYVGMFLALTS